MKQRKLAYEKLLDEFNRLRRNGAYSVGQDQWDKAVKELAFKYSKGQQPTMSQWVDAAKDATVRCDRCNGSGRYSWGACVNGRMTHEAACFRCEGKGKQNQADFTRNWGYDQHRTII